MLRKQHWLVLLSAALLAQATPGLAQDYLAGAQTETPLAGVSLASFESNRLYDYYSGPNEFRTFNEPLPPDPFGLERLNTPTPVHNIGFQEGHAVAHNTRPDAKTLGIRLDSSFDWLRETNVVTSMSEHQTLGGAGVTLIPLQGPCWILGLRIVGLYSDNQTMTSDTGGFTLDMFGGTRYKSIYSKVGVLWDVQGHFNKTGLSYSAMAKAPLLGVVTLDTAHAFGNGQPRFDLPRDPRFNLRQRRVEIADYDGQVRIGKFFGEYVQAGGTFNYLSYNGALDEWGAGAFCNLYLSRFSIQMDVTGGDEALRGFINFAYRWGANDADRPRDCRLLPVDAVSWVSKVTNRDIALRLRESFTGPLRPFPPGLTGGAP